MIIGEKVCFEVIVGRIDGLAGRLVGLCVGRVDFAAFGLSVRLAEGFIVCFQVLHPWQSVSFWSISSRRAS